MKKLTAYTDGSYNQEKGRCGYGVTFVENEVVINTLYGGFTPPTGENGRNINGELRAAEEAVKAAIKAGAQRLEIRHDCDGVSAWAELRWKRNKSFTVAYAEFMQEAMKSLSINFVSVKSHSGNALNNTADRAAKKGSELYDDEPHWEDPTAWERYVSGYSPDDEGPDGNAPVNETADAVYEQPIFYSDIPEPAVSAIPIPEPAPPIFETASPVHGSTVSSQNEPVSVPEPATPAPSAFVPNPQETGGNGEIAFEPVYSAGFSESFDDFLRRVCSAANSVPGEVVSVQLTSESSAVIFWKRSG